MTQTIKAIETRYKGYRFRSRLEARWAVFFDHLGWKWKYEHQGYKIGYNDQIAWLPDFEVVTPEGQHLYVEVKGHPDFFNRNNEWLDHLDFGGGPPGFQDSMYADDFGPDVKPLLLLGDIPNVLSAYAAMNVCVIAHHKGVGAFFVPLMFWGLDLKNLRGRKQVDSGVGLKDFQARVYPVGSVHGDEISDALLAARRARFEHGESGA